VPVIIEAPADTIRRQTPTFGSERDISPHIDPDVPSAWAISDVIERPPAHPGLTALDQRATDRFAAVRPVPTAPATADSQVPNTASGWTRPAVVLRLWAATLAAGVTVGTVIEPVPDGAEPVTPAGIAIVGNVTVILL
jgi:hypothetical protein